MTKLAIIGAGVTGLGCAVRIKETYPSFEVTIITKDVTPNTTGDGSAGLWGPFLLGKTPEEKVLHWSRETHDFFRKLWQDGEAGSCLTPCLRVDKKKSPLPSWRNVVYGFKEISDDDLDTWRSMYSLTIESAYSFMSFTCEPKLLLKYLMDRFLNAGGKIVRQEVNTLEDVKNQYDVVINCTGLGARTMVPDKNVYPVRGQVARVKAPWIYHILLDDSDDGNYIIPNTNSVVLGGTHQENDFNLNIDLKDSKFIRDGCEVIIPGLKNVDTLFEWVGLRPGRDSVRLEIEATPTSSKNTIVIHNYGHGGSGVTLFWGCAGEVLNILSAALKENTKSKL